MYVYAKRQHLLKIVLILSHRQVERRFSSNKGLIDGGMFTDSIVALRSVHDYLKFHDLGAQKVEMTKDFSESCRQARKKYFGDQRSKALSAEETEQMEARKKVGEDIEIVNSEIRQTLFVIENLKKSSVEIGF